MLKEAQAAQKEQERKVQILVAARAKAQAAQQAQQQQQLMGAFASAAPQIADAIKGKPQFAPPTPQDVGQQGQPPAPNVVPMGGAANG
jgi:hypothetical protein